MSALTIYFGGVFQHRVHDILAVHAMGMSRHLHTKPHTTTKVFLYIYCFCTLTVFYLHRVGWPLGFQQLMHVLTAPMAYSPRSCACILSGCFTAKSHNYIHPIRDFPVILLTGLLIDLLALGSCTRIQNRPPCNSNASLHIYCFMQFVSQFSPGERVYQGDPSPLIKLVKNTFSVTGGGSVVTG